ncbi:MAG: hypothetical protein AAGD38_13105 [Acidobacteriota bacterium]
MKSLGLFLILVLTGAPLLAVGQTYWGCYQCDDNTIGGVIPWESCVWAGDSEHGRESCNELNLVVQQTCVVFGTACFNVDVNGNGGSNGSGANCTVYNAQVCPAQCMSCERLLL